jgi:DNA gyrase/topoisomerase IV subunit B
MFPGAGNVANRSAEKTEICFVPSTRFFASLVHFEMNTVKRFLCVISTLKRLDGFW